MTAPLWTAKEAALATNGQAQGDWEAQGVSIDSRAVAAGDLFIALKGPSFDGHDFVADALGKGAAAAMVAKLPEGLAADAPLLRVGDTLEALTALGQAARTRGQARFIGVTGSVGKTGTKEALKACLAAQGPTAASVASFNNHWGVPLSLARMAPDSAYGVFEVGMNHAGEISALTAILRPHVAIITTIAPVHLEFFDSVEGIADAKAEIFESMGADGTAVLNRDNAFYDHLAGKARAAGVGRIVGFGTAAGADLRLESCDLGELSSRVRAEVFGRHVDYELGLPGEHSVMNSLAVLGAIEAAGADLDRAMLELAKLAPLKGRGAREKVALPGGGQFELIDDSYNANPSSLRAAVRGARRQPAGRRRPPHRGPGRHAGARRRGRADARRPGGADQGGRRRSGLLLRVLDGGPGRGVAARPVRRPRLGLAVPRPRGPVGPRPRRRRPGQGFARQPHGGGGRGPQRYWWHSPRSDPRQVRPDPGCCSTF